MTNNKKKNNNATLRNTAELERLIRVNVGKYNVALSDDAKMSELVKLDAELDALEKEYARSAFNEQCKAIFAAHSDDATDAMAYAAENLRYTVLKHRDVEGDDGVARTVVEREKSLDLVAVARYFSDRKKQFGTENGWQYKIAALNRLLCLRVAVKIGLDAKTVAEKYALPKAAADINLGKTPTSNTQLLKQLQTVIDSMCFIDDGNGKNKIKVTSHDVAYLTELYAKKGRGVLTVAAAKSRYCENLIAEILHKIITEKGYKLEFKEKKEENDVKVEPKTAEQVESAKKSAKESAAVKQDKERKTAAKK